MKLRNYMINTNHNCNIRCAMCLCGNPVNVKISKNILHKAFIGVDSIGTLYVSGGEVLLYPKLIYMLKDELITSNVTVNKITITTNGTLLNEEGKKALLYLYDGVQNTELVMSIDKYHRDAVNNYITRIGKKGIITFEDYQKNAYNFCDVNKIEFRQSTIESDSDVLKMGNAKNMPGAIEADNGFYALRSYSPKLHYYKGYVGITADGYVVRCDYENDNIESLSVGNVLNSSIEEIIYNRCIEELKRERLDLDYTDSKVIDHVIEYVYKQN